VGASLPRTIATASLAALALAGCGGGGDSAETQIADMLRRGFTTVDATVLCERTLSPGLARQVYGGTAKCLAAERGGESARSSADDASVTKIAVRGDRGSAFVVMKGGDQSGTRGVVSVVRGDDGWRLDAFSTAFLRSGLRAGLQGNPDIAPDLEACLTAQLDALDDAKLRRLALGAMAADPAALRQMQDLIGGCVQTPPPAGGQIA
jgi:hypothetical protein